MSLSNQGVKLLNKWTVFYKPFSNVTNFPTLRTIQRHYKCIGNLHRIKNQLEAYFLFFFDTNIIANCIRILIISVGRQGFWKGGLFKEDDNLFSNEKYHDI